MKQQKTISLRHKSILILIGFILSLLTMLLLFTGIIFTNSLKDLELQNAKSQTKRIENAMMFSLDALTRNISDWAIWTDTYDYVNGTFPEYVESNISYDSFANLELNLVMFVSVSGEVINQTQVDFLSGELLPNHIYYVNLIEELGLRYNDDPDFMLSTIIETIDGPMLFVSSPILPTDGVGDVAGNLIFGRLLDEATVAYISSIVEIEFTIIPHIHSYEHETIYIASQTQEYMIVHKLVDDYFEDHSFLYEIKLDKTVTFIVMQSSSYIIGVVVTIAIIGSVITVMFLDYGIFKRLHLLSDEVRQISNASNFLTRVSTNNVSDEITYVAKEINLMLDSLNRQEKEINLLAYHDYLTGLPNRLQFNEFINQEVISAKQNKETFAVLFLDLDSFKSINDTMGHKIGDDLLVCVSTRIEKALNDKCVLARAGGDEFLILSKRTTHDEAAALASKVLAVFKDAFVVDKQIIYTTTSIGVAIYPTDGIDSVSLIKNADIAMYYSKDQGKNKYQICDMNLKNKVRKETAIRSALFEALKNNEFFIYYQPQIDVRDNRVIGFEALLRWNHPKMGFIAPNDFIPIAEKTGLIDEIGLFVLRSACRQNQKWLSKYGYQLPVAINLSIQQFLSGKILDQIVTVLHETKLNPKMLEIEITESIVMKDTDLIIQTLNAIKKLGVVVTMDDFGTGFSSMTYLKELPIDIIKIAMPFVQDHKNPKSASIIRTIINLASSLKLEVIAEGVETYEQSVFLQHSGCYHMQGYYYFKPMPANTIEETIFKK